MEDYQAKFYLLFSSVTEHFTFLADTIYMYCWILVAWMEIQDKELKNPISVILHKLLLQHEGDC